MLLMNGAYTNIYIRGLSHRHGRRQNKHLRYERLAAVNYYKHNSISKKGELTRRTRIAYSHSRVTDVYIIYWFVYEARPMGWSC